MGHWCNGNMLDPKSSAGGSIPSCLTVFFTKTMHVVFDPNILCQNRQQLSKDSSDERCVCQLLIPRMTFDESSLEQQRLFDSKYTLQAVSYVTYGKGTKAIALVSLPLSCMKSPCQEGCINANKDKQCDAHPIW